MKIKNRSIGPDQPPLVIAEIGINHGGSLDIAIEMVDAAHRAGAEIIKIQTHVVEDEMSSAAKKVIPGNSKQSIYSIMAESALSFDEEIELKKYIESKGVIFMSTPFSRAAAEQLEKMDVDVYKIGSGECNNYPLIQHIANYGKPMIVSTGMNNIESIEKTAEILEKRKISYALLHTTNLYPTPPNLVRLGALEEMKKVFPNTIIGLSDHTTSNHACFAAVALGASILERHFTDSMNREGPDIVNSMDPIALKELIEGSRLISLMRGGKKEASKEEQVTIDFAFATVVTIKKIKKGELFSHENLWVKRPGTGEILAKDFESIIGKVCNNDLDVDIHLKWQNIL